MTNDPSSSDKKEESALSLIQQIKDKKRLPSTLTKEERQSCVEVFWIGEGQSTHWMAEVLGCDDRTIRRDKNDITDRLKLIAGEDFAVKAIGMLISRASAHEDHLIRVANHKDTPAAVKVQSRIAAWQIQVDLLTKLQSFGLAPFQLAGRDLGLKESKSGLPLSITVVSVPGKQSGAD